MSIETVLPEKLAMLVHRYREALAPDFGCPPSACPEWEDLSQDERSRLIAATRLALLDLGSEQHWLRVSGDLPPAPGFAGGSEGKECGC
jgi:hypothetical protein